MTEIQAGLDKTSASNLCPSYSRLASDRVQELEHGEGQWYHLESHDPHSAGGIIGKCTIVAEHHGVDMDLKSFASKE